MIAIRVMRDYDMILAIFYFTACILDCFLTLVQHVLSHKQFIFIQSSIAIHVVF